jgi:kumamolisin
VSQGVGAAVLEGAQPVAATPAQTSLSLSFVLAARNLERLERLVERGFPRPYLTVHQFARQYGASPSTVAELLGYLHRHGLRASVDPDHLDVQASGPASAVEAALGVPIRQYRVTTPAPTGASGTAAGTSTGTSTATASASSPSTTVGSVSPALGRSAGTGTGRPTNSQANSQTDSQSEVVHGTTAVPSLPAALARQVVTVSGLTNAPVYVSNAVSAVQATPGAQRATTSAGGAAPYDQRPQRFADRYGLAGLYGQGDEGQGEAVGIVTLAALNPDDAATFWRHVGVPSSTSRVDVVPVDGGSGAVSLANGSDETTLDVEQAGAAAPDATIDVYEAPNTDAGFADAWYDAVSQNTSVSLSTGWGYSETAQETDGSKKAQAAREKALDQVLMEAAAQGQSAFAAAGDTGAYAADDDIGSKNLSVLSPADSRYITATGGTTLPGSQIYTSSTGGTTITVKNQRAWSWDYLWPYYRQLGSPGQSEASFAKDNASGGGGGYSASVRMPRYQSDVLGARHFEAVDQLVPIDFTNIDGLKLPAKWEFDSSRPIVRGKGTMRAVPDLSADADPETGYEMYDSQFQAKYGSDWQDYGGTSFVAPQMAGAAAVIDEYVEQHTNVDRVGFWNPSIYRFASSSSSPFTPLDATGTSNDNLYYTGRAGTRYNAATGLGIPDLTSLAEAFERQA